MDTLKVQDESGRYLPIMYKEEMPFWEGAQASKLLLPKCSNCGKTWYPVGPVCPFCLSSEYQFEEMSGRGHISSYVIYHKAFAPWLESQVPYAVAQVELEEGPRLTTNIVGLDPEAIRIGLPVRAVFEKVTAVVTLIKFRELVESDSTKPVEDVP